MSFHSPSTGGERSLLPSPFPAETAPTASSPHFNSQQSQDDLRPTSTSKNLGEEDLGQTRLTSPFFTLIEDTETGTHYHPTVHYIFSDDDADQIALVTEAALQSLSPDDWASNDKHASGSSASSSFSHTGSTTRGPREQRKIPSEREERYLLLDLDVARSSDAEPQATELSSQTAAISASSLTPSWQVLSAELTSAPTWNDAPTVKMEQLQRGTSPSPSSPSNTGIGKKSGHGDENGSLMLRIQGTGGPAGRQTGLPEEGSVEAGDPVVKRTREMDELVALFGSRMEVLRRVVQAGGGTEDV